MPSSASAAAHGVVPAPAVDVHVDEAGCDDVVGRRSPAGRRGPVGPTGRVDLDGRDAAVLDDDVSGPYLVEQDEPPGDGGAGRVTHGGQGVLAGQP